MKTLSELFQEDSEEFSLLLAGCDSERDAGRTCEEELSRLLSIYNDQNLSQSIRCSANDQISALRAALPILDAHGEVRIVQEHSSNHNQHGNTFFRTLAWGLAGSSLQRHLFFLFWKCNPSPAHLFLPSPAQQAPVSFSGFTEKASMKSM